MNVKQESTITAILAAGGLVLQTIDDVAHTVIHRPEYDDWSIPKGKIDLGETLQQTALREVYEETFLECSLGEPLSTQHYPEQNKTVHYCLCSNISDQDKHVVAAHGFTPHWEVDPLRWVPLARAVEVLDYVQDRSLIIEVRAVL